MYKNKYIQSNNYGENDWHKLKRGCQKAMKCNQILLYTHFRKIANENQAAKSEGQTSQTQFLPTVHPKMLSEQQTMLTAARKEWTKRTFCTACGEPITDRNTRNLKRLKKASCLYVIPRHQNAGKVTASQQTISTSLLNAAK